MTKKPTSVRPTLPRSIIDAVPASAVIAGHLNSIFEYLNNLEIELRQCEKAGATQTARAFVALHRLKDKANEVVGEGGRLTALFERYKTEVLPSLFEQEGVPHVPLSEGYRVGVSVRLFAGIRKDQKDEALEWLRKDPVLRDLIQETVNAGSLSAAAKHMSEEENRDLPVHLFNVALIPSASVTPTKTGSQTIGNED